MSNKASLFPWATLVCLLSLATAIPTIAAEPKTPETKQDHDARMAWWRDARFGLFIHWGLYAVPAGEWNGKFVPPGGGEWIMHTANIPVPEYEALTKKFNPVKYDPVAWVRLAKEAGMKYIVITSKHHDGFNMFDTKATDYNIVKTTPYGKDVLKPLADECRKQGIHFCVYYSIMDWHHPAQIRDNPNSYNPTKVHPERKAEYIAFMKQQFKELIDDLNPEVLWFDGQWLTWWTEADAVDIADYLKKLKPTIIFNNRLGTGREGVGMNELGKRHKEYVGDFDTPEQNIPVAGLPGVDWETCMTMNDTWGFRADDKNWKSPEVLVRQLIDSASKGGNYLLNVGPTAEGEIPAASIDRLEAMGKWMAVNGESIYGSAASPFAAQLAWGRCTQKPGKLYLHVFEWPKGKLVAPGLKSKVQTAYLLSDQSRKPLPIAQNEDGVAITLPETSPDPIASVVVLTIAGTAEVTPPESK
jgi:alpha-L-fucosidase